MARPGRRAVANGAGRTGGPAVRLWIVAVFFAACLPGGFDWMLEVRNTTDDVWYVRVHLSDDPDETLVRVARIPVRAEGTSVAWFGTAQNPIELLDEDCRVVGTFTFGPDDSSVSVAEVPGVDGRVVPYRVQSPEAMGEIEITDDCRGFLYV